MLTSAIGDLLPSAIGVALSPIPIIAVILMLGTPRARSNGPAFAAGWVVGLIAVNVVVLVAAGGAGDSESTTSTAVDWIKVGLGVLFLVMAVKQWQGRPRPGTEPEMPKWMAAIDGFTPPKAAGLAVVLSAANPKNLALAVSAAATIAQADLSTGDSAVAVAAFVVVGSITVAGPVVAYLVATERSAHLLADIKGFMTDHNSAIMMAVLLVLGAKMLGGGLAALT